MKKLTALAVLLTVIGTASFASSGPLGENTNFKVLTKSDSKFELVYVSSEESDVRVSIYDEKGNNICSSYVKEATKFRRTFDFSKLDAGKYSVVVKNDDGTAREQISYKINRQVLQTFVAKLPDGNALKVHVGDFAKEKPVYVKIYNEKDRIIHKDQITKDAAFSRVYNLGKAEQGKVTVVVENNGEFKSFTHNLN